MSDFGSKVNLLWYRYSYNKFLNSFGMPVFSKDFKALVKLAMIFGMSFFIVINMLVGK